MNMSSPERDIEIDAITLEVLRNALQSIAEEMGAVLKNTSFSPNIKERMDASCAIFDAQGGLVAQAEHVPVHLGSMLVALRQVLERVPTIEEGDVILVNDPYIGGAHLPDITLIGAVFANSELIGFITARAHHSDVGGMEPGSMPGRSTEVYQEGVVIPPVKLYRRGEFMDDIMSLVLANVRTPDERRGDLNAQLAALRTGQKRLLELAGKHGKGLLTAGLTALQDYAERRIRKRIADLPDGSYTAEDALDNDGVTPEPVPVKVKITIKGDRMTLDFKGSAALLKGNINAVAPMTYSASFYAIKIFTDPEVPVNGGTFRPIKILIPDGCFLNAKRPAAVCAGNTEATHRVCDTVLKAAAQFAGNAVHAASQGTMNLIGIGGIDPRYDRPYTYIETIAGGEGGKPWGDGTDGVQCNMTNTMNTPVESLEITYPLRVERYEFRPGSGGDGKYRGGLGVTRSVRSVGHEARVSLSADRRIFQPYGLHGGGTGQVGEHATVDSSGAVRKLPGKTTFSLPPDSIVVVNTPGGGGWGDPAERAATARESDLLDEKC
jgi:N-methylhydantoinase B